MLEADRKLAIEAKGKDSSPKLEEETLARDCESPQPAADKENDDNGEASRTKFPKEHASPNAVNATKPKAEPQVPSRSEVLIKEADNFAKGSGFNDLLTSDILTRLASIGSDKDAFSGFAFGVFIRDRWQEEWKKMPSFAQVYVNERSSLQNWFTEHCETLLEDHLKSAATDATIVEKQTLCHACLEHVVDAYVLCQACLDDVINTYFMDTNAIDRRSTPASKNKRCRKTTCECQCSMSIRSFE